MRRPAAGRQESPSSGDITVAGHDRPVTDPADADRAGALLMHQEPLIIDDFTIGENIWLYTLRAGRDVKPWWAGDVPTTSGPARCCAMSAWTTRHPTNSTRRSVAASGRCSR